MGNALPKIAILLAIYNPNMDWLVQQLNSLNEQTYQNLVLYARDDCSSSISYDDLDEVLRNNITNFPYVFRRNEENIGSNRTFEILTGEAEGTYFAYCDQDDVWMPEKIRILYSHFAEDEEASLVCSDMNIIDGDGNRTASSITEIRRHHIFKSGNGLTSSLLISNFVVGCTMLVKSSVAKASIPFCPYMYHDHYIALSSAIEGKIISVESSLINYRIHGNNQTSVMCGVKDKDSYYKNRIVSLIDRLEWLKVKYRATEVFSADIDRLLLWANARKAYYLKENGARRDLWKMRSCGMAVSLFEMISFLLPEKIFVICVNMVKRNIL